MRLVIGIVILVWIADWIDGHKSEMGPIVVLAVAIGAGYLLLRWFTRDRPEVDDDIPLVTVGGNVGRGAPDEDEARHQLLPGEFLLAYGLRAPVLLRYRDVQGRLSERTVAVTSIGGRRTRGRGTYLTSLTGFCHLREDTRTFKGSRIEGAFDPRTGEEIANLGAYLLTRPDLILGDPPAPPSVMARRKGNNGTDRWSDH